MGHSRQAKLLLVYLVNFFFVFKVETIFSLQIVRFIHSFPHQISALLITTNVITCGYNVNVGGRLMSRMFFVFRHYPQNLDGIKIDCNFYAVRVTIRFIKEVARISWENNWTKTHTICLGKSFRYQYDLDYKTTVKWNWFRVDKDTNRVRARENAKIYWTQM